MVMGIGGLPVNRIEVYIKKHPTALAAGWGVVEAYGGTITQVALYMPVRPERYCCHQSKKVQAPSLGQACFARRTALQL